MKEDYITLNKEFYQFFNKKMKEKIENDKNYLKYLNFDKKLEEILHRQNSYKLLIEDFKAEIKSYSYQRFLNYYKDQLDLEKEYPNDENYIKSMEEGLKEIKSEDFKKNLEFYHRFDEKNETNRLVKEIFIEEADNPILKQFLNMLGVQDDSNYFTYCSKGEYGELAYNFATKLIQYSDYNKLLTDLKKKEMFEKSIYKDDLSSQILDNINALNDENENYI